MSDRRRAMMLAAVLLLALVGVAEMLILDAERAGESGTPIARGFPTPAPVTFIPPTFVPYTPDATILRPNDPVLDLPLPALTLDRLGGGTIALPEADGAVLLLNFWATWCAPCREEMPLLQQIYSGAAPGTVRVIALTDPANGQDLAAVQAFVDELALTFPIALGDVHEVFEPLGIVQIPTTLIVDGAGIVRFRHIGELHLEDVEAYLALLGAPVS